MAFCLPDIVDMIGAAPAQTKGPGFVYRGLVQAANLGSGMSACFGHAIGSRFSLLLLAAAMLAACQPEAETAPPEVRPVRTVTVVKRESGETVAFTGRIEAENETRLAFRIGGRMIERAANVGQFAESQSEFERQLLEPGEIYEVDLEIWPMGFALPAGSRLRLTIQGKDFERPGATGPLRGVAWFTHDDPTDRPSELFAGTNSIYTGGPHQSYLLLPMLPSR